MKLIGKKDENGLFYLPVIIKSSHFPRLNIRLKFFVDTGACVTTISDTDAIINQIPYHGLQIDSGKVRGIGGEVSTRRLPDCEVFFLADKETIYSKKWNALRIIDRGDKITAIKYSQISLLGIEFIKNFRISFQGDLIILEKEVLPPIPKIPSLPTVIPFKAKLPP